MKNKILLSIIIISLCIFIVGCEKKNTIIPVNNVKEEKIVEIPITFIVDPVTGRKNNKELVDAFNKKYKGKYKVKVNWIMETEEEHRNNLKRENVIDKLPAVITDIRLLPSYYEMMVKDKRIENLAPYINKDKEWKEAIDKDILKRTTEKDGSIYLSTPGTSVFSMVGLFWNKELFKEAGLEGPPKSFKEFWEDCNILNKMGITPLALHTEGTGWAPMLLATAMMGQSQGGIEFMETLFPKSYKNKWGEEIANNLSHLFRYSTEDCLGADFDIAYNNFFSGKCAMIPNGYWMINQMPEGYEAKVGFAAFPNNISIASPEGAGWSVVSSYSDRIKKGAIEFLKFRTLHSKKEKEKLLRGENIKNPVMKDYIEMIKKNPKILPNYQIYWNSILQEEILSAYLPKLARNQISIDYFVNEMENSVIKYNLEQNN